MAVLQAHRGDFTLVNAELTLARFNPRIEGLNTKLIGRFTSASMSFLNPKSLLKTLVPAGTVPQMLLWSQT